MSHIVEIQTEIRDPAAIQAACRRLELPEPTYGETRLFSGAKTGWAVQLPGWLYPLVCDVTNGSIAFDNFGGAWGDPRRIDEFRQKYAAEKAKIEAGKLHIAERDLRGEHRRRADGPPVYPLAGRDPRRARRDAQPARG